MRVERGRTGIYFGSWYTDPILARVFKHIGDEQLEARLVRINNFEKALVDDGALLVKLWFHLSEEAQRGKWHRTGGSTGAPLSTFWGRSAHRESLRAKYRAYQQWDIDIFDRGVHRLVCQLLIQSRSKPAPRR